MNFKTHTNIYSYKRESKKQKNIDTKNHSCANQMHLILFGKKAFPP